MLISVVQIGNSHGIRLPKNILNRLNIKNKVEMTVHDDELIIKGADKTVRQGWDEAFARMSELKADKMLLPENIDSDSFEWVW